MENFDCFKFLDPSEKPLVYINKSLKKNAGNGIFAKNNILAGTPIIIYFGDILSNDDIFDKYTSDKNEYILNYAPYLRKSGIENYHINGKTAEYIDSLNLKGYLVNDYLCIESITTENINKYNESKEKNNVYVKETKDFPIYCASRNIKKGEELYCHYGIANWLLQKNCDLEKIKNLVF